MMPRLPYWLTDRRTLLIAAIVIVAAFFVLGTNVIKMIAFWVGIVLLAILIVLLVLWAIKRIRARKSSEQLGEALTQADTPPPGSKKPKTRDADVEALRERMRDAVKSIKTSRLGQTKGTQALYELPWYMIIGNPAAGKSTAIINSGLRFPFAEEHGKIVQGVGGTRNCDWYFTSEGIILDTAGRYSVESKNRTEWLSFLDLLRKHRPRAPINGIIIAASVADLTGNRPEFTIELAKKLRQRVQELTECLEVIAPVYVVFTKADLIAGFNDLFRTLDDNERERTWGATLPFSAEGNADILNQFDKHFDELSKGLREMSLAQMSLSRGNSMGPGMLTLPLEFSGIKGTLRTFLATLFEDNPYQHKPVFRGFYFTSALQEPASVHHASDKIAQQFQLTPPTDVPATAEPGDSHGYFLHDLFRKVIFADKALVRQYSSKSRTHRRYAVLLGAALALGLILAGWAWSYTNNRQLVRNAQADLTKAVQVQKDRVDLASRLQALQILQDRLTQLQTYRDDHPLMLGLGLYQGDAIEAKVRHEYFHGMRQVMLSPVTQNIESYLAKVVDDRDHLSPPSTNDHHADAAPAKTGAIYQAPSPTNSQDAYNALKTYLMLARPDKVEPVQLSDQLTHFWRGWLNANRGMMSRAQLISSAQSLMAFYVSQYNQPDWPTINNKVTLVSDTRGALRNVMSGMSALKRVYARIKARAATRFPSMTVASILSGTSSDDILLAGSYAVPGAFTQEAWNGYVKDAFKDAANHELDTSDWVLQTSQSTDLTLSGSPEQLQKQLEVMYDKDYVAQWQRFLKGISVRPFADFTAAEKGMNKLGDPKESPMRKLLTKVYTETSWDNPSTVSQGLKSAKGGFVNWFKRVILRRTPSEMSESVRDVKLTRKDNDGKQLKTGPIGSAFTGVANLVIARDSSPSILDSYLQMLDKIGARLSTIKNHADVSPGARKLMAQTLDDGKSVLAQGLQMVDHQMLDGLSDNQRHTLRPLLLRPLMQTFHALILPTERGINKIWTAQVYQPFQKTLAGKYPFDSRGQVQANNDQIAQIFGPTGEISKFATKTLGPLVIQRGNTLIARQWANMGITLAPTLITDFPQWIAPLGQTAGGSNNQSVFKILPHPGQGGISEYTININGQSLRYQNTPPTWKPFVWSRTDDAPAVSVKAVAYDGRTITIANFTGPHALTHLFTDADAKLDKQTGIYTLTWSRQGKSVTVNLEIVSGSRVDANGSRKQGLLDLTLPATVAGAGATATQQAAQGEAP